jgi:hypothetical protein
MPKVNRYWNSDPDSLVELERPQTYDLCKCCELVNQLVWKEKRLKRALWLDRANRAKAIKWHEGLERYLQERKKWWPSRFSFMKDDEMYHVWYKCWSEVERKCLAKAEEYK